MATVTGIDERDCDTEKSIGTLEMLQDTVIPANTFRGNGKLPFIVNTCVSEGYEDNERQSLALVLNTPVAPACGERRLTSIYTASSLVPAPEGAGDILKIELWNHADEEVFIPAGTVVATLAESPSVGFSADMKDVEQYQELYEYVLKSSNDLMKAVHENGREAQSSNSDELYAILASVEDQGPDEDLKSKLKAASWKDIVEMVQKGDINESQVHDYVTPLITINDNMASFARGVCSNESSGRIFKHVLSIVEDDTAREVHKLNSDTKVTGWEYGDSVVGATDLIAKHIPKNLRHSVWIHDVENVEHAHGHILDFAASQTHHAFIIAVASTLSPTAVWSIETDPMVADTLDRNSCNIKTLDLSTACGMAQRRRRVVVSNVHLKFPKSLSKPKKICEVLGDVKGKVYDVRGRVHDLNGPAPGITRNGLRIGKHVHSAKPLSVRQLAKFQEVDDFEMPARISPDLRRSLIARASPPCFGRLLAETFIKSVSMTETICAALHRGMNSELDDKLAGAIASFDVETSILRLSAIADMKKDKIQVKPDEARLHRNRTPEELDEQRRQNLKAMAEYLPDYDSQPTQKNTQNIYESLKKAGFYDKKLPDWAVQQFEEILAASHFSIDGVFREAGPDMMSLRIQRLVTSRPYPMNHPEKREAMKLHLQKLVSEGVIYRNHTSPYRSAALLVRKPKWKEGDPLTKKYRLVQDYRALSECFVDNLLTPRPI